MKRFNKTIIVLLLLITTIIADAQGIPLGDAIPEFACKTIFNYSKPLLDLSDFRGKALVLDFWSITCSSCIEEFPKLEELQNKYSDSLNIILVCPESQEKVQKFFERFKKTIKMPNLPMIVSASSLFFMFQVRGYPRTAWIDKNGIFQHKTDGGINENNIADFLNGGKMDIVEFIPHMDFIKGTSLIEQPNKDYLDDITYYSYVSHFLHGTDIWNVNKGKTLKDNLVQVCWNDGSIEMLLMQAFGEDDDKNFFRHGLNVILDVPDTLKYVYRKKGNMTAAEYASWEHENVYRCDFGIIKERKDELFQFIQMDLARYFNVEVSIEKRPLKCLALIRTSEEDKIKAHGLKPPLAYQQKLIKDSALTSDTEYIRNFDFKRFFVNMRADIYFYNSLLLVDKTGYEGKIDFIIPDIRHTDFRYWRQILKSYDLDIQEKELMQDFLVIRERKRKN